MRNGAASYQERIDRLIDGFVRQETVVRKGEETATEFAYSVAQTHRIFRSVYGESPGAFRRRLLLERAADELTRSDASVWKVGVSCGFTSAEGFSRAFRRAFQTSPRDFRRRASRGWIPSPNTIHYWRGCILRTMETGETKMNLIERLIEHDIVDTRKMLERAATLTTKHLDAKILDPQPRLFLECFDATIRGRLDYLVVTKECWLAAVHGRQSPVVDARDKTPRGMLERWGNVETEWRALVADVEREARWDEMFIDALCEQPETFSFGGMIAHVLDQSARGRAEVFRALTALGHEDAAYGDPLTWEMQKKA